MTPSELLTRAADLIRDTAAAASPGPWKEPYWDGHPGDQGWWVLNGLEGPRESAVCSTFSLNKQGEADARWITLMSPAVAPMIEKWLRDTAAYFDEFADYWVTIPEQASDALDLAKVILGNSP